MMMYNELQIESTRQYQTVVFYSQFRDENATLAQGEDVYESYTCAVINQADAFDDSGPDQGVSLFFYNYYGKQRLVDVGGLATELNLEERIPLEEEQVWSFDREETKLTRKSGGTDAGFICTAIRDFDSAASQI